MLTSSDYTVRVFARMAFTVIAVALMGPSVHAQSSEQTYLPPTDDAFDAVRETGHICMDGLAPRLLSTERRPPPESCSGAYAECDGEACLFVTHGAVRTISKQALLDHGVFISEQLRRLDAAGQKTTFFPGPTWTPPGFADPVCSFYHQLGFDCPQGSGFPGGGSSPPPGNGVPGNPGPDDNCWVCTAMHGLCFYNAKKNLISHAVCVQRFESCAARRCG